MGTGPIFLFRYQSCTWPCSGPFCWQNPCCACNSGIDLVLLLNRLSLSFVPTPSKSLKFTRFRRSYINYPAVVLIKVTLLFCLVCALQSGQFFFFFCSCLSPMIVHLHNLFLFSTPVARMLLTARWASWVSRWKNVKQLFINMSKLKVGVKHSLSHRTTFSVLVEEATCFPFFAPWYDRNWTT